MAMSKRQRAIYLRYAQYALILIVVAAIVVAADWAKLRDSFFKPDLVKEQFPDIIKIALKNTIIYTACAFAFGLVVGLILA